MIASLLEMLAASSLAGWMTEHLDAFAWVESFHVIAISLVFGTVLIVDLRLLGKASNELAVGALSRSLLPITWLAFAGAVVTGFLMFVTNPVDYFNNVPFRLKMLALLLAGANMAVFHATGYAQVLAGDAQGVLTTRHGRTAAALSIGIWLCVIAAGRWIGFTINPY